MSLNKNRRQAIVQLSAYTLSAHALAGHSAAWSQTAALPLPQVPRCKALIDANQSPTQKDVRKITSGKLTHDAYPGLTAENETYVALLK